MDPTETGTAALADAWPTVFRLFWAKTGRQEASVAARKPRRPEECMVGNLSWKVGKYNDVAVGALAWPKSGKFEHRDGVVGAEDFHGASFGTTHDPFLGGLEVVVAGKVKPAVDQVERQLGREIAAGLTREGSGGVGRYTNFTCNLEGGIALERDDVGRRGVSEEVGVELRKRGVGEEDEGEFTGRGGAKTGSRGASWSGGEISVERVDYADDSAAIDPEARMAIGDGNLARGSGGASSQG